MTYKLIQIGDVPKSAVDVQRSFDFNLVLKVRLESFLLPTDGAKPQWGSVDWKTVALLAGVSATSAALGSFFIRCIASLGPREMYNEQSARLTK